MVPFSALGIRLFRHNNFKSLYTCLNFKTNLGALLKQEKSIQKFRKSGEFIYLELDKNFDQKIFLLDIFKA